MDMWHEVGGVGGSIGGLKLTYIQYLVLNK